jgi:hypothetical protein
LGVAGFAVAGSTDRRLAGSRPPHRDLTAALPPLTAPQVAAVARLAVHLDAASSHEPAA